MTAVWRSPLAILGLGVGVFMIYAFPGYMSYDSVLQLSEARSGHYTDWHPPAMAALWRGVELFVNGPVGMLVLQVACFVAGAYLLLRRAMTATAAAWCTALLLWTPPVATTVAVIWKDSLMTGFLLLGTVALLAASRRIRVAGLVLLLAASTMRHNAFTITLPIIGLLFVWNPDHRRLRRYGLALAVWLAITLGAVGINRVLTDEQTHVWHQSLAMMDIAGTLRFDTMPDAEVRAALAGTTVRVQDGFSQRARKAYNPGWMWNEIWNDDGLFAPAKTADERAAIARAWREIVPTHPRAYLTYRWQVFAELVQLRTRTRTSSAYIWFTDVMDPIQSAERISHDAAPAALQDRLRDVMQSLGSGLWFRPYFYLALALVLLPFTRRDRVSLALLVGAFVSTASLFFLAPTPDFRYSIWVVVSSILVAMTVIGRRLCPEVTS